MYNPKKLVWHSWFAWYPLIIEQELVWLEFVERRLIVWGGGEHKIWKYRLINER